MQNWYYAYRVDSNYVDVEHKRPIILDGPFKDRSEAKRNLERVKSGSRDLVFTCLFQADSESAAHNIAKDEQFNHWAL